MGGWGGGALCVCRFGLPVPVPVPVPVSCLCLPCVPVLCLLLRALLSVGVEPVGEVGAVGDEGEPVGWGVSGYE